MWSCKYVLIFSLLKTKGNTSVSEKGSQCRAKLLLQQVPKACSHVGEAKRIFTTPATKRLQKASTEHWGTAVQLAVSQMLQQYRYFQAHDCDDMTEKVALPFTGHPAPKAGIICLVTTLRSAILLSSRQSCVTQAVQPWNRWHSDTAPAWKHHVPDYWKVKVRARHQQPIVWLGFIALARLPPCPGVRLGLHIILPDNKAASTSPLWSTAKHIPATRVTGTIQ